MRGRSVRAVLAAAVLSVAAAPAHAAVPATSLTAADYLAFADRLQVALNPTWDAKAGAYRTGGTLFVRVNAAMLYAHANAALAGHTGASRRRAGAVARPPADAGAGVSPPLEQRPGLDVADRLAEHAGALLARPEGRRGARRRVPGARQDRPVGRDAAPHPQPDRARRPVARQPQAPPRPGQLERRPLPRRLGRERSIARAVAVPRRAHVVPRPCAEAQPRRDDQPQRRLRLPLPPGPSRARRRTATRRASTRAWCSASCCRTTWPGSRACGQSPAARARSRGAGSSASCTATGRTPACSTGTPATATCGGSSAGTGRWPRTGCSRSRRRAASRSGRRRGPRRSTCSTRRCGRTSGSRPPRASCSPRPSTGSGTTPRSSGSTRPSRPRASSRWPRAPPCSASAR